MWWLYRSRRSLHIAEAAEDGREALAREVITLGVIAGLVAVGISRVPLKGKREPGMASSYLSMGYTITTDPPGTPTLCHQIVFDIGVSTCLVSFQVPP